MELPLLGLFMSSKNQIMSFFLQGKHFSDSTLSLVLSLSQYIRFWVYVYEFLYACMRVYPCVLGI